MLVQMLCTTLKAHPFCATLHKPAASGGVSQSLMYSFKAYRYTQTHREIKYQVFNASFGDS